MTPSLSAARIILDGLQLESRYADSPEDRNDMPLAPPVAVQPPPARRTLVPRALAAALARRAERRALNRAIQRLSEISPHLLADIGVMDASGTWTQGQPLRTRSPVRRPVLPPLRTRETLPIAAE